MILKIFSILIPLLAAAENPAISSSKSLRAVIDLGSGTTKLGLFEVELSDNGAKFIKELPEGLSLPLPMESSKTHDGLIPEEMVQAMLKTLRGLRERALKTAKTDGYKQLQLAVVGTHALRTAKNKDEVVKQLNAEGFPTRAISQAEEARAGFKGAVMAGLPEKCFPDSLVVWDVGGGSMQLTREKGDPDFIGLAVGAETFRQHGLKLKKRPSPDPTCGANPESPNPIGKNNILPLKRLAINEAGVPFKNMKHWPLTCVVGIGGIHTKAIEAQVEKNWAKIKTCVCGKKSCSHLKDTYSRRELDCLSQNFAVKNDCDPAIKGAYAKTSVTNLVLILGFMEKWKIDKVSTRSVNMGPAFATDASTLNFVDLEIQ